MNDDPVWATADYLRQIFAIILALAVTEAFKQLVADKADDPSEPAVRRDALVALVSFLLLLVPFYHGMARYLYETYRLAANRPSPYSGYLLFDVVAFTVEAGLFFVMSRSLRFEQWRRFYTAVVGIHFTDAAWGTVAWLAHSPQILPWLILNAVFAPVFLVVLLVFKERDSKWAPSIALAAMALRTTLDYVFSWHLYFPG